MQETQERHGFYFWVGRKWQPIPVFLPREFNGQRSLAGYIVHGVTKSQTRLSMHDWRGIHTNIHNGLCKYQISLEKHWGGPMLPEKNTFLLPQGKGSNLSREFLASRFFFFDPSLFHKIGMEISTDYNLSACLKHQRSDLVFPQPKRKPYGFHLKQFFSRCIFCIS